MYWPIGTPRIYATATTTDNPTEISRLAVSHDGLQPPLSNHAAEERPHLLSPDSTLAHDAHGVPPQAPLRRSLPGLL